MGSTMSVSFRWSSSLCLLSSETPSQRAGVPIEQHTPYEVYYYLLLFRLYIDLSMEKTLYGGPYEWALFAAMEMVQLMCCFAVYPAFIVSG